MNTAAPGVDNPSVDLPSPTRLLLDLQRVNKIAQRLSGGLEVDTIARYVTDGLVNQFDCALARIWVVEPDQTALRLVASAGLYTHTNGSFALWPSPPAIATTIPWPSGDRTATTSGLSPPAWGVACTPNLGPSRRWCKSCCKFPTAAAHGGGKLAFSVRHLWSR